MTSPRPPHFAIPSNLVRTDPVNATGRSATYQRPDFGQHGTMLLARTVETEQALHTRRDADLTDTVFVKVTTPPDLPIRNEKGRLRNVGLDVVAVSTTDPTAATAATTREGLRTLAERITHYAEQEQHPGRSYLSAIESISPVPAKDRVSPEIDPSSDEELDCILLLYSVLSNREQAAVRLALTGYLAERGHNVRGTASLSTGVGTVATRLRGPEIASILDEFATVRWVRPDHVYFLDECEPVSGIPSGVAINPPATDVLVAVLDSGVNDNCPLLDGLVSRVGSHLPSGQVPHLHHGTFVASRLLFGDDIERDVALGRVTPHCRVFDVPVFGCHPGGALLGVPEQDLAARVDSALATLPPAARVVNLSFGTNVPIRDNEYSLLAQVIDARARERDLVVVTTAGNIRGASRISTFPHRVATHEWRIDPPGEAVLALTVGAITRRHDPAALAPSRFLSPFSRVGPGADRGLKPELVAHGGNCLSSGRSTSQLGVHGLHGSGTAIGWDIGTSFAAPLVAAAAARIVGYYGTPTANMVKALLCHFAAPAGSPATSLPAHLLIGFGEPILDACLWSGPHSAAFLFSGLARKTEYQYVPFFVPDALAPGSRSKLRIRGTVVLDPPVNPNSGQEYSLARMALLLRKRIEVGFRDVSLESPTLAESRWAPVMQFDNTFSRSYSSGPWELRLRLYTRGLPDEHEQRYSVVLEVIDSENYTDVWAAVEAEAGAAFRPIKAWAAA